MLIQSTQKYKQGTLSKDKYVEVAMQVGQMADYVNKVNKEAAVSTPVTPQKFKDTKLIDKILKVSNLLPYGSPNIENLSDEQLINLKINQSKSRSKRKIQRVAEYAKKSWSI